MTDETTTPRLESFSDLTQRLEVAGVTMYELSGRSFSGFPNLEDADSTAVDVEAASESIGDPVPSDDVSADSDEQSFDAGPTGDVANDDDDSNDPDGYSAVWHIGLRIREDELAVRARVDVDAHDGEYGVDGAIFYSIDPPARFSEDVLSTFVERVGLLGIYPYIRERLHALSIGLGNEPVLLSVIRAGQYRINLSEADTSQSGW